MLELHRAVAAAETKASLVVASERMKMERLVEEVKAQVKMEVMETLNKQERSNENCWNCGRAASETCSGCNRARYCGPFCQHKDWENHHKVC
ncbi:hypothetical protein HELRODRAFT_136716, partial [Helobdella robusta]|uniref:MYND-type domain-containing protein n=1 Tax=Helobdella robusta TaxID=6412 RepID=T1EIF5_HELRO